MSLTSIIFLICLITGIVYSKRKERELIELVTSITRGEWSVRRMVLKGGINPKAIFHDLYIQKTNGKYIQVDIAVTTKAGIIVFGMMLLILAALDGAKNDLYRSERKWIIASMARFSKENMIERIGVAKLIDNP